MAYSKAQKYSPLLRGLANLSKCLGHPARIKILKDLLKGPKTSLELAVDQPISQKSVSRHCQKLVENELIHAVVLGQKTKYFLDWKNLPSLACLALVETGWEKQTGELYRPRERKNVII
ncbi:MAG: winged helix-turn-helix transcriptional regulator [Saprospiraceae bacterium]|nr:winged helix-turn-helix transcriptional regulator [Saprospiraceae bacterium]